jgi:hypothetical protein
VFTAQYALSPYIKQIRFVFKGLKFRYRQDCGNGSSPFPSPTLRPHSSPPTHFPMRFNIKIQFRIIPPPPHVQFGLLTASSHQVCDRRVFISRFSLPRALYTAPSPIRLHLLILITFRTVQPLTVQFTAPPQADPRNNSQTQCLLPTAHLRIQQPAASSQ